MHKKVLGRGIGALIPGAESTVTTDQEVIERLPVARIRVNPAQPRSEMDPAALEELASSIKRQGLMQPITVRKKGYEYELIAGERRLQAARKLGLTEIPALVRDVPDDQLLELALIENIQREDLNPIDEARAYEKLIEILSLTQQSVAERVGKDRATIANALRLLQLPDEIQKMVAQGRLTSGHARALLALGSEEEMLRTARDIVARGLTVRDIEELGRASKPARHKGRRARRRVIPELVRIEEELQRRFGTRVRVQGTQAKGAIAIEYYSVEELERILEEIGVVLG